MHFAGILLDCSGWLLGCAGLLLGSGRLWLRCCRLLWGYVSMLLCEKICLGCTGVTGGLLRSDCACGHWRGQNDRCVRGRKGLG